MFGPYTVLELAELADEMAAHLENIRSDAVQASDDMNALPDIRATLARYQRYMNTTPAREAHAAESDPVPAELETPCGPGQGDQWARPLHRFQIVG